MAIHIIRFPVTGEQASRAVLEGNTLVGEIVLKNLKFELEIMILMFNGCMTIVFTLVNCQG
jgi:hypothetical protein